MADRLSLHGLAADCEWALTQLWDRENVYTSAALELSQGALQRVACSLRAGIDAARKELQDEMSYISSCMEHVICGGYISSQISKQHVLQKLEQVSKLMNATASAQTMMQWRISKEEYAEHLAAN